MNRRNFIKTSMGALACVMAPIKLVEKLGTFDQFASVVPGRHFYVLHENVYMDHLFFTINDKKVEHIARELNDKILEVVLLEPPPLRFKHCLEQNLSFTESEKITVHAEADIDLCEEEILEIHNPHPPQIYSKGKHHAKKIS